MPTKRHYEGQGKAVVVTTPSAGFAVFDLDLVWSRYQIFFPGTKGVASPVI
jgi:hypothetical protein